MSFYPVDILPKTHFRRKINLDDVAAQSESFFVCRVAYEPLDDYLSTDDFTGEPVLDEDLFKEHIIGLSVNLMGGLYNASHLTYRAFSIGSKYWDGKQINIEDFELCHKKENDAFPIFYSSDALHRKTFPHLFPSPVKDRAKAIKKAFCEKCIEIFSNGDIKVVCELFIDHKPTNLNYWHAQVEMKPALEDDDKSFKNDGSFRKDIYTQFVSDVLTRKFLLKIPSTAYIYPCAYCGIFRHCRY